MKAMKMSMNLQIMWWKYQKLVVLNLVKETRLCFTIHQLISKKDRYLLYILMELLIHIRQFH